MPSVSTIPMTDACADFDGNAICPDCGQKFDDTVDPGCETCNDQFGYDNPPRRDDDDRFNAWDGDDDWADAHGYGDWDDDDDWVEVAESSDCDDPTIY